MEAQPRSYGSSSSPHDYEGSMAELSSSIAEWSMKVPPGSPGIHDSKIAWEKLKNTGGVNTENVRLGQTVHIN
jgi:hypothetical protein